MDGWMERASSVQRWAGWMMLAPPFQVGIAPGNRLNGVPSRHWGVGHGMYGIQYVSDMPRSPWSRD